jgi:hypothetical protein
MSVATHSRLAEILRDIEARCDKYKPVPLEEAQRWADENWSLGDSPLIDLIKAGVWYCNLHGMDQTIGFDLNKLGLHVCRFLDMYLTDSVARVELFGAVVALREFAHGVRTLIDSSSPSCGEDDNVTLQSNIQTVKNYHDQECDGPCGIRHWRHNGQLLKADMRKGAWKMAKHLWGQPNKAASIYQLLEPVYGDGTHPVSKEGFRSLCRDANKFFIKHRLPWRAIQFDDNISLTAME